MTREERYDAEIAPLLLKAAQLCQEHDLSMACSVEFERHEEGRGYTCTHPATDHENAMSAAQKHVYYATKANGNADKLIWAIMRDATKHGHSSVCLHILGVPETPSHENKTKD